MQIYRINLSLLNRFTLLHVESDMYKLCIDQHWMELIDEYVRLCLM